MVAVIVIQGRSKEGSSLYRRFTYLASYFSISCLDRMNRCMHTGTSYFMICSKYYVSIVFMCMVNKHGAHLYLVCMAISTAIRR